MDMIAEATKVRINLIAHGRSEVSVAEAEEERGRWPVEVVKSCSPPQQDTDHKNFFVAVNVAGRSASRQSRKDPVDWSEAVE